MPAIEFSPEVVPVEPRVPAADLKKMAEDAGLEAKLHEGLAYARPPGELAWSWLTTARNVVVMATRIGRPR